MSLCLENGWKTALKRVAPLKSLGFALPALVVLSGAAAADQPDITDLVTDTLGYVTIRPDVVLLEGESMGSYVCRFDVDDRDFEDYATDGSLEDGRVGYICIPLEEFEK